MNSTKHPYILNPNSFYFTHLLYHLLHVCMYTHTDICMHNFFLNHWRRSYI